MSPAMLSPVGKLAAYVCWQKRSHSDVKTHWPWFRSKPIRMPPIPANKSMNLKSAGSDVRSIVPAPLTGDLAEREHGMLRDRFAVLPALDGSAADTQPIRESALGTPLPLPEHS